MVKEPLANAGDVASIPGLGRSLEEGNVSCIDRQIPFSHL